MPATPFKVGTVAAVKLAREEARTRRLQPGEEERLLLAADGLRDLIVAALETGCRRGELLSLQWSQVRGDLFLPAGKTKAKKPRRVPISTVLQAVLDARRNDPAGEPIPPDAFVFGDEVGRRSRSIKTAWRLTCQRAKIDGLHFHDLRREAGSRWMDAGVPLATIQRWLGHHNISQTSDVSRGERRRRRGRDAGVRTGDRTIAECCRICRSERSSNRLNRATGDRKDSTKPIVH